MTPHDQTQSAAPHSACSYPANGVLLSEILLNAAPNVLGMLGLTVMQFIDGLMLSWLDRQTPGGGVNLAASYGGGIMAWIPLAFLSGLGQCVNTLSGQSFGRGANTDAATFAWQGLWCAIFAGLPCIGLIFAAPIIFGLLGQTGVLLHGQILFFDFLIAVAPVNLALMVLTSFYMGVARPMCVAMAGLAGNLVNGILDWLLIFGHAGLPKLGLLGSAVATATGTLVSFGIMASFFLSTPTRREFHSSSTWPLRRAKLLQLLRLGLPAGCQWSNDVLTWAIFTLWLVNRFGSDAAEAQSAVMRFIQISYLPAVGLGSAVNAVVARYWGAGDTATARRSTRIALGLAIAYMSSCGLLFWLGGHVMAEVFLAGERQVHIAVALLIFAAFFQTFDAVNIISISALRGTGDTLLPAILWVVLSWGICVAGGYAAATFYPKAGPRGPWLMATIYVCVLGMANLFRWRHIAGRPLAPDYLPAAPPS